MRNCLRVFLAVVFVPLTAALALAQTVSGRVIDSSGRTLPRAYVRALAPGSTPTPAVFTDTDADVLVYHYYADNGTAKLGINLLGYDTSGWPYVY